MAVHVNILCQHAHPDASPNIDMMLVCAHPARRDGAKQILPTLELLGCLNRRCLDYEEFNPPARKI